MAKVVVILGLLLALAGAGCSTGSSEKEERGAPWRPVVGSRWQYQLSGDRKFPGTGGINVDICERPYAGGSNSGGNGGGGRKNGVGDGDGDDGKVGAGACVRPEVFDIDLYADAAVAGNNTTLNTAAVKAIHARGAKAICYIDSGSVEKVRPDYPQYVEWHEAHGKSLIGKSYPGFPEENYANINNDKGQRDFVLKMQEARVRKCVQAGFDAVEFDVVNAHEDGAGVTGWQVSADSQLVFNRALADMAHRHGLAAGLKNDLGQIPQLVSSFDFMVNEECWEFRECDRLKPFIAAGKPVFGVEYKPSRGPDPLAFCREAVSLRFGFIKKGEDYLLTDQPYTPCR
ncbi:endo alpha-1,4 polygalactosaminidase [Actinomadura terrae]|uniref:endo alpha-1,4 polygalactosaminidase n=1 Tax=Actinomadura terrae TaxID=604353 RepID=UPI001FA80A5E|nr:endo alpha-1,4 polygalactosaminidase [Actinomadura terrae]